MILEELENKLEKLGYNRENEKYPIEDSGIIENKDFTSKTLNHTLLKNHKIINTKFDNASATGSIYDGCDFIGCSINQTDFEYCEFRNCYFDSDEKTIASFNNSNFENTRFNNLHFIYSTFTGAYFQNCTFYNVNIEDSTLENSIFQNCSFIEMDLGNLNMDFVQLDSPKMKNVILPFSQIPYMFGGLEYIFKTQDAILIRSEKSSTISKEKYIEEAIPLLINYWDMMKKSKPEYYFPLSNIYLTRKDYTNAISNLRNGLKNAVDNQDYRLIKFYCKLISESDIFNFRTLYSFFNLIKHMGNHSGNTNNTETRNFIRNIGEIENILFSVNKKGNVLLNFRTNISTHDTQKIGILVEKLFAIGKMKHFIIPNNVEVVLGENSPLIISVRINGEKENMVQLLAIFFHITKKLSIEYTVHNEQIEIINNHNLIPMDELLINAANDLCSACLQNNIDLLLVEYYINNCDALLPENINSSYYFNNNTDNWEIFLIGN